jgi:hypothetical protein
MEDIIAFRKMITPSIIQTIFWVMLVIVVLASLATMLRISFIGGLVNLVVGPIMLRVSCEVLMIIFSINDRLCEISEKLGAR